MVPDGQTVLRMAIHETLTELCCALLQCPNSVLAAVQGKTLAIGHAGWPRSLLHRVFCHDMQGPSCRLKPAQLIRLPSELALDKVAHAEHAHYATKSYRGPHTNQPVHH